MNRRGDWRHTNQLAARARLAQAGGALEAEVA